MAKIREICPELAITARDELHEVEKRIPEDISALRSWIEKQPHLNARTDDHFLLSFLRGTKYSIEKAKHKIDYFYTIRSLSPDLFLNKLIDDKVLKLTRLGPFVPLPKPLKAGGPRVYMSRYKNINPNEFTIHDILKHHIRMLDYIMREDDNTVIGGVINIVDLSALSLAFMLQFDPVLIKKFAIFTDKAIPFRIKGIHLINTPREAATIINITRSLLAKKLKERMFLHKSLESLYEYVPREYLPEEYGGENGRIEELALDCEKHLLRHKEFFEEDVKYLANEDLRLGTKITSESLFGLDGSFRKLEID